MSRSWTESWSESWRERLGSPAAPRATAGIALGRDCIASALVARTADGPRLDALKQSRLTVRLFEGVPDDDTAAALAAALENVVSDYSGLHLPVMLTLPDPAVATSVMDFETLPRSKAARRELLAWRLGQESGTTLLECAAQEIGREGERRRLLVTGADPRWLDCIEAGCRRARVRPWTVRSHALSVFNRYYDDLSGRAVIAGATGHDAAGGALFVPGPEAWAVLLWDGAMQLRHVHARWSRRRGRGDAPEEIAAEIERLIIAYVAADPRRSIARLYALTPGTAGEHDDETGEKGGSHVIDALDRRLHEPCVRLHPHANLAARTSASPPPSFDPYSALALSAALDS